LGAGDRLKLATVNNFSASIFTGTPLVCPRVYQYYTKF
jgi:hypothetical protein